MAGNDVVIRGLPQLQVGTRRLVGNIDQAADRAFLTAADQIGTIVRGRVPRLTGRLAGSVDAAPADRGAQLTMGGGLPYGGWIEYGGTRGRPYVPTGRYLYPTAREAQRLVVTAAEQATRAEIRRATWPPVPTS